MIDDSDDESSEHSDDESPPNEPPDDLALLRPELAARLRRLGVLPPNLGGVVRPAPVAGGAGRPIPGVVRPVAGGAGRPIRGVVRPIPGLVRPIPGLLRPRPGGAARPSPGGAETGDTGTPAPTTETPEAPPVTPTGRPYGGFVLRHGNDDQRPQYGDAPAGIPVESPGYVRELKHDLLFMAYYGDRERQAAEDMGGPERFEAMTVGAILALKLDLALFYGVPTTADPAAAAIDDARFDGLELATFDGPIYFDPAAIGDHPIEPIFREVIQPIAAALGEVGTAHAQLITALDCHARSRAPSATPDEVAELRSDAKAALREAKDELRKLRPEPLSLPATGDVVAARKLRSIDDVLGHPCFDETKRKPWGTFARQLRSVAALEALRSGTLRSALAGLVEAEGGHGPLATEATAVLDRYDEYVAATSALDDAAVADVVRIVGGLPETFAPYLQALRAQAAVDHGTALYIRSIMAGITIGSDRGKVRHPGRKLVYRTASGGIVGEPETRDGFADLVIAACKDETGRFVVPPLLMLERQKNESGFRATSRVRDLALTAEEYDARVPQLGIDWSNWGVGSDGAVTKFYFSELFTKSVARSQTHPGYHGPIVHSRGAGAGQVTLPTLMEGVSPDDRASKAYGYAWASGIPVSKDNETAAVPPHWSGAEGSIRSARDLLRAKLDDRTAQRDCTFGRVAGGVAYDCCRCLARFDLGDQQDLVPLRHGGTIDSYQCTVSAARWPELFGEALAQDTAEGRSELPCSWLRAVQLYAGTGIKGYGRILKTAREIVALTDPTEHDEDDSRKVLRAAIDRARRQL